MADQQIREMLLALDGGANPDDAFSESLFARLAPIAVAAGRRDRTWYGRMAMTIRSAALPRSNLAMPQLRTAILLAALLALLVALAAITGSRTRDPNRIVLGSEAVYLNAPAFDMTVGYSDGGLRRFRYDGEATLRVDLVHSGYHGRREGRSLLADARSGRLIELDPISNTGTPDSLPSGTRATALLDLRWGADLQITSIFTSQCLEWEYVEETAVHGRAAHHVRCTSGRHQEYWVDVATGFVLRSTDVPTDNDRIRLTGEVQSLEVGGPVDPTAFAAAYDPARTGAWMPGGDAPFEAGVRAISNTFAQPFAATPGEGWRSWGTDTDMVGFVRGPDWNGADGAAVLVLRLINVTDVVTGRDRPLAPGPEAVIDWLRGHPYFEVGPVERAHVGDVDATSVAFTEVRPADFDATCPLPPAGGDVASCWRWFRFGEGYWYYGSADHGARATILDVGGTTITILTWAEGPDEAADLGAIDDLLASIEFLD